MNTSVLVSLIIIGVAGSILGSTTLAAFQDTETGKSEFTAAKFGVQTNWAQSYNGGGLEPVFNTDSEPVFDFGDLKPGDHGRARVTLQLENNSNSSGRIWLSVNQTSNLENNCEEPETYIEDDCEDEGELGDYLLFTVWSDDGDGQLEDGETILFEGTAHELSEQSQYPDGLLLDGDYTTEEIDRFNASEESYVGIKWLLPFETGNQVQSDSKSFDFRFYTDEETNNTQEPNETEENLKAISFVSFCVASETNQLNAGTPANPCPESQSQLVKFEMTGGEFMPEGGDSHGISINSTSFKDNQESEVIEAYWTSQQVIETVMVKSGPLICNYPGGLNGTVESCVD